MASFNRVILMGNLTRDPQLRYTPGGSALTEIGLAVNRSWFDKQTNQKKEETTFVDVTVWGRQAEIVVEYLTKGRPLLVEGRLQLDTWEDKQTQQKRSKLRVICENMTMLGGRETGSGSQNQRGSEPSSSSESDYGPSDQSSHEHIPAGGASNDEIPF